MVTYEDWCEKIKPAIENAGDPATVVSVLTDARDMYRDLYGEYTAMSETADNLRAENERLTNTNRELFLRIGQQSQEQIDREHVDGRSRAETITVEELFKED